MTYPEAPIVSPCVKTCVLDAASGLCIGCLRTLDEIGAWSRLSVGERAAVMAELDRRRARLSGSR